MPPVFSVVGFPICLLLAYSDPNSAASTFIAAVAGWLYYIILTAWSLRTKRHVVFMRAFVILCISLFLNLAGCAAMKHGNWKIGRQMPAKSPEPTWFAAAR